MQFDQWYWAAILAAAVVAGVYFYCTHKHFGLGGE
jgi:hypothetical protein